MLVSNWKADEPHGELDRVANKCGTDKGSRAPMGHGYSRWYETLFAARRTEPLRLLEIGIGHGANSLRLWESWLPNADIVGADIRPELIDRTSGRWRAIQCDCGKLADLAEKFSGAAFDVIIDDGSHREEDVFTALNFFWTKLNEGGFYAIEDLSCSTADYFTDLAPRVEPPSAIKSFADRLRLAMVLLRASRLQILPSQLRSAHGGQCLAVLHK